MTGGEPGDERSLPATPPLFWKYEGQREIDHTQAVTDGFGTPATLRAAATLPRASWRTAVLGLTAPGYRTAVPPATRMLVAPTTVRVERLVSLRAADPERSVRLPFNLRLAERLPDELFLDLFDIPSVVLQAGQKTWATLQKSLTNYPVWDRYRMPEFWAAGRRWLGNAALMRQRLMAGGLLRDEWEKLNVWVLGALQDLAPLAAVPWLKALRDAWHWVQAQVRRFQKEPAPVPGPPPPAGLRTEAEFHLLGLELQTRLGDDLLACSSYGLAGQPALLYCPASLPPDLDLVDMLRGHNHLWQREHRRRQKIYYWSGKIISTVIKLLVQYVALGPVGLIIVLLRLLAEGLFQVVKGGRQLTWPSLLPAMEVS